MFGDVDHLHNLFESTWRCCSFFSGWIGSLISKHFAHVVSFFVLFFFFINYICRSCGYVAAK